VGDHNWGGVNETKIEENSDILPHRRILRRFIRHPLFLETFKA
jgi:hypothetical protein